MTDDGEQPRARGRRVASVPRRSSRARGRSALACHVNPDGDALGSMLGLFHVLRAAGVDVVASFPTPFVVAPHYRELPGLDLLTPPEEFPTEPDVMVTFDCGSLGRLGDLEPAAKAARELIVDRPPRLERPLRHDQRHRPRCGRERLRRASGSIDELGLPLNRDAAVCLYAALVCDTGRFQYETTTPEVFDLARRLAEFDVPVARLVAHAVRGAPVRVPPAARRGAGAARTSSRAAVRVDRGHPGDARRATASSSRRSRASSTSCGAPRRPRSRACSRKRPTAPSA